MNLNGSLKSRVWPQNFVMSWSKKKNLFESQFKFEHSEVKMTAETGNIRKYIESLKSSDRNTIKKNLREKKHYYILIVNIFKQLNFFTNSIFLTFMKDISNQNRISKKWGLLMSSWNKMITLKTHAHYRIISIGSIRVNELLNIILTSLRSFSFMEIISSHFKIVFLLISD